jgi:hypothetical protein
LTSNVSIHENAMEHSGFANLGPFDFTHDIVEVLLYSFVGKWLGHQLISIVLPTKPH